MPYDKSDFWTLKARKEGYPARSVYKLREIDEKCGIFRAQNSGRPRVLDLGAAPGSWSLYVLRRFPRAPSLLLAAADLLPLSRQPEFDREDFFFIQGDVTSGGAREALRSRGPYTVILSDAAPATTGSRAVDAGRSLALAEEALSYADEVLESGGNMAVKVFQGGDEGALLAELRKRFCTARAFKPKACRSGSFETYFIGLGKKG